MITTQDTQVIQRSGDFKEKAFTIKASAKAFKVLSSGLYSDKATAIIRELSCNAADIHQFTGKSHIPFKLELPNNLEPTLIIRDYGTGLSEDDVDSVYTSYFESTKTDTNDQIGCLGLGSKSPFSYTDNFTVTSYFEGVKSVYNMFLNENGCPAVLKLFEIPSDEPSGLEIQISIKSCDIYEFQTKAANIFKYFKVKPEILGYNCIIPEIKYIQKRSNWGIVSASDYRGARAVMGNIAYPMNNIVIEELTTQEKAILKVDMDIFFDIGELDIAASRESLSLDPQTKLNIKNRLIVLVKEITEELQERIKSCNSLWEARLLRREITQGDMKVFKTIVDCAVITYQGQPVELAEINCGHNDKFDLTLHSVPNHSYRRAKAKYTVESVSYVIPKKSIEIYIRDVEKPLHVKCRIMDRINSFKLKGDTVPDIILINQRFVEGIPACDMTTAAEEVKTVLGMHPSVTFPLLSSLPYNPPAKIAGQGSNYNPKNVKKVFTYNNDGEHSVNSDYWTPADIDMNLGGVYVIIDRYCIEGKDPYEYIERYLKILRHIKPNENFTIVGVKPTEFEKTFYNDTKWVKLSTFTQTCQDEFFKANSLTDSLLVKSVWEEVKDSHSYYIKYVQQFLSYYDVFKIVPEYSEIITLVDSFNDKDDLINLYSRWETNTVAVDKTRRDEVYKKFSTFFVEIEKRFPILAHINDFGADAIQDIKVYIELMLLREQKAIDNTVECDKV